MGRQKKEKPRRYSITFRDDLSPKAVESPRFTGTAGILTAAGILVFILLLAWCLIAFTPIRVTIPGYPNQKFRETAVSNAVKIDSLEREMAKWQLYADNISNVLLGKQTISLDSIVSGSATRYLSDMSEEQIRIKDSTLRALVAEEERLNLLSSQENRQFNPEATRFYIPVKGLVINRFDPAFNPGLDISANPGDMVMSVLDGTVVLTAWTAIDNYIIAIQHDGNLISIYKRNQRLLLSPGDAVKGGTPIALAAGTGVQSDNDHVHIEIWKKGEAVDPEKYISFQ